VIIFIYFLIYFNK